MEKRRLITIQTREKLNDVFATDERGPGGANHQYTVIKHSEDLTFSDSIDANSVIGTINMQCGPRKDENSISGFIDSDLLEIVRDRLTAFQNGEFASPYNEKALEHIEAALMYLNRRVEDRIQRNVLGTNNK